MSKLNLKTTKHKLTGKAQNYMRFLAIVHRFVIEMNFHSTPQGAVSQLLDSLDEIQMLSGGNAKDTSFLQTFLEDHTFQCLLEVSSSRLHLCASSPVLT